MESDEEGDDESHHKLPERLEVTTAIAITQEKNACVNSAPLKKRVVLTYPGEGQPLFLARARL